MPLAPTEAELHDAVARAVRGSRDRPSVVIAHGSWVRGDFWWGQSDIDLIVIGAGDAVPEHAARELRSHPLGGVQLEAWETSEANIEQIRRRRVAGSISDESGIGQFDISGFDVVDQHRVVWGTQERDPLHDLPVPRGKALMALAAKRIVALLQEVPRYGDTEMNRIACDALKASALLYLLRHEEAPTRDKRQILAHFLRVVPDFDGRQETSKRIWELYRAGDKNGTSEHRATCRTFVERLAGLLAQPPAPQS